MLELPMSIDLRIRTWSAAALLLVSLSFVSGCSGSISKSASFDATSEKGLVVLGTTADVMELQITLAQFDLQSGIRVAGIHETEYITHTKASLIPGQPPKTQYHVVELEPGGYKIPSVSTAGYPGRKIFQLPIGAFTFKVDPGKIYYLGELTFEFSSWGQLRQVRYDGRNDARASAAISEYSNVKGELEYQQPNSAGIDSGPQI